MGLTTSSLWLGLLRGTGRRIRPGLRGVNHLGRTLPAKNEPIQIKLLFNIKKRGKDSESYLEDLLLAFTPGRGISELIAAKGAEPFAAPGRASGVRVASRAAVDAAVADGAGRSPAAASPAFGAEDSFAG